MKKIKVFCNYFDYSILCDSLVEQLKTNKQLKFIYGIPTGGLPLAVHLAKHLNLELLDEEDLYWNWNSKELLICDDIIDTGITLETFFKEREWLKEVLIVSLYWKYNLSIKPNYFAKIAKEYEWIVFPWEPKNEEMNR